MRRCLHAHTLACQSMQWGAKGCGFAVPLPKQRLFQHQPAPQLPVDTRLDGVANFQLADSMLIAAVDWHGSF